MLPLNLGFKTGKPTTIPAKNSTFGGSIKTMFQTGNTDPLAGSINSLLTGDFLGSALGLVSGIKGLFDGSSHRERTVAKFSKSAVDKFASSNRSISDVNALYRRLYDLHAYESTKQGDFQKKYLEPLVPITQELTSAGYTKTMKSEITMNRDFTHEYPVWKEPIYKEAFDSATNFVGDNKGMSTLALAGLGFLMFKLLKKK